MGTHEEQRLHKRFSTTNTFPKMGRIISIIIFCSLCYNQLNATDLRDKLQALYKSQIGVIEIGNNNSGEEIDMYLGSVGLESGNYYCSAYIAWCFKQVGILTNITGWSRTCCPDDKLVYTKGKRNLTTPQKGSVFWWKRGGGGHTGFIDRWGTNHTLTNEANVTDENGQGGVHNKIRPTGRFLYVADWVPEEQPDTTGILGMVEDLISPEPTPVEDPDNLPKVKQWDNLLIIKLVVTIVLTLILLLGKNKEDEEG